MASSPQVDLDPLRPALARAYGAHDVRLDAVRPISAGASRLTWSLDVVVDGQVHPLILQRIRAPGLGFGDVAAEARLLRAAHTAGVPAPAVILADPVGEEIGGGYIVTTRVDGETLPRRLLRERGLDAARDRFAADCGRALAIIHAIPVAAVAPLSTTDPLDFIEAILDSVPVRCPALELATRWLRQNRPPAVGRGLVHGDFRNGNLVVGPGGLRAVLDWELSHVGEPLEDIGWLCARAWRWGGAGMVGGMGSLDQLVEGYAEAGGAELAIGQLDWWLMLATVRWGAICLEQARVHLSGEFNSVELAALGRRVAEIEYEALRMLP